MRPLIKICGIKMASEAASVAALAVEFLGVIFAKSLRQVGMKTAREIAHIAHENGKLCVGVFAGQSECEIMEICEFAGLDTAQIYDEPSENLHANLKDLGVQIWRVFSVKDELPKLDFRHYDLPLFDCKGENLGGNGVKFNWEILRGAKPFSFALAGGIGEDNVLEAIKFKPKILDINSRVEDENLVKVPAKIERILGLINNLGK